MLIAESETRESYGFLPNPEVSIHLNACHVVGNTSPDVYFSPFTNKTFHELTLASLYPQLQSIYLALDWSLFQYQKSCYNVLISTKALTALIEACS